MYRVQIPFPIVTIGGKNLAVFTKIQSTKSKTQNQTNCLANFNTKVLRPSPSSIPIHESHYQIVYQITRISNVWLHIHKSNSFANIHSKTSCHIKSDQNSLNPLFVIHAKSQRKLPNLNPNAQTYHKWTIKITPTSQFLLSSKLSKSLLSFYFLVNFQNLKEQCDSILKGGNFSNLD